jgi:hypothetical protein
MKISKSPRSEPLDERLAMIPVSAATGEIQDSGT